MTTQTELTLLPPKETALQVFTAPNGLDPYLKKIRDEIDLFHPGVTTKKGRDAIASIAYKVAKSKTALDDVGKALVAELKDVPKKIDAERKRVRDVLDAWKDEVRQPLTDYENAEAARVAHHRAWVESLSVFGIGVSSLNQDDLNARIAELDAIEIGPAAQEFEADGHRAKQNTLGDLKEALAARVNYDNEQAELARLRRDAAEREQREREARIAREAEDKAHRESEARAQQERDAVVRREADAKAATERREMELQLQTERAERERAESEARAAQAVADAERRAAEAVASERRRVEQEQARADAEAQQREANENHRRKLNRAAVDAMVKGGVSEETAKLVIKLIAKGHIPAVSITY